MKKILVLFVTIISLFLITGCNANQEKNKTYTNKYECSRKENLTTNQVYYITKIENLNEIDNGKTAVEVEITRSYDFNTTGDTLLAYYDITTYNYLIDYDMSALKTYFENTCKNIDKDTYKSCNVSLKDKVITVISQVDLDSKTSKEYLSTVSLDTIKQNYNESPYICK